MGRRDDEKKPDDEWTSVTTEFRDELYAIIARQKEEIDRLERLLAAREAT